MTETQASVSKWAAAAFGPPSTHARVAGRLIEECAELVREATAARRPDAIADECADVAIVLLRLAQRLGIALPLGDRGDLSGQWLARNLSLPATDLANEALRRCSALLDMAAVHDGHPGAHGPGYGATVAAQGLADALECLCRQSGTTLQAAVDAKMAVNRTREWKLTGDGHGYHLRDKAPQEPAVLEGVLADVSAIELDAVCVLPRGRVKMRDLSREEAVRIAVGLARQVKGLHADALFSAVERHKEGEAR